MEPDINKTDAETEVEEIDLVEIDLLEISDKLDVGMHRVNVCLY